MLVGGIFWCSGPAFNTGLLYGNLDEVLDVVKKWDVNEVLEATAMHQKRTIYSSDGQRSVVLVLSNLNISKRTYKQKYT